MAAFSSIVDHALIQEPAMTLMLRTLALLVAVTAPGATLAHTYYVDPQGDDASNGRTLAAPFETLSKAVSVVQPGDTIELRAGVHRGGLAISRPGSPKAWITLKPHKREKAIIDGNGTDMTLYFYGEQPMYWRVQNLEIRGGNSYVVKIDTPRVKLLNNNLHGSKADIIKLVKTADDVVIKGNEIHHPQASKGANAQGIDIVGASRTYVARNYVHDIASIGMFAKGNATDTIFEYNRLENVYQRGIMLGQATGKQFLDPDKPYESYNGIIRHNVIRNVAGACLAAASSFNARIYKNRCYNVASRYNGAIYIANESELNQANTGVEIRDNIVVRAAEGRRPLVFIAPDALTDDTTLVIENNTYWAPPDQTAATFAWERGAKETKPSCPTFFGASFDKWRRLTGKDARSLLADPGDPGVKRVRHQGAESGK
jgi:hypothetical protein